MPRKPNTPTKAVKHSADTRKNIPTAELRDIGTMLTIRIRAAMLPFDKLSTRNMRRKPYGCWATLRQLDL